jgi:Bacterial Ig-like domain (group 3)/FG-GAP-like repeat/FG-GAP repeat
MFCKSANLRLVGLVLLALLLPESIHASTLFKSAQTYPSGGTDSSSVAIADLNGDGKPDLVVSNYLACDSCTNGSVGVLLGNGDGTFQAAQTYGSGGNGTTGVAVADVNGDGKPDVVVANACASGTFCDGNSNTGSVAVLLGRGDGTLRRARVRSAGGLIAAGYIALGDFNVDSKLDVAVGERCAGCGHRKIAVLMGNGDGTLQSAQSYDLPGKPQGITLGDINGDGALDLVVGLQTPGGQQSVPLAILFGNGDGSFQEPVTTGAGVYPALADMNGDGKLDLVVTTACSDPKCTKGGVGVLLGNGDGSFQAIQIYSSGGYNAVFVAVGDLNRDGKRDVFVANYSGKVGTLLGVGDGTVLPVQLSGAGDNPLSLAVGDVNGDGKPDVVVANWFLNNIGGGGVTVLLNNTFWKTTTALTSSPNPSVQGQRVTLTATVTTEGSIAPTGKVVFKNAGTAIGSASLMGGVATLIKGNLPVGTLSLTATYQGDTNSAKSTSPVRIQVVNPTAGHP